MPSRSPQSPVEPGPLHTPSMQEVQAGVLEELGSEVGFEDESQLA